MQLIAHDLRFPEGPVWASDGSVYFAEIAAGRVSRIDPAGTYGVVAEVGGGPNGLAVGPDGKLYVCNNGGFVFTEEGGHLRVIHGRLPGDYVTGSIQRVDPVTGAVEVLYTHCGDNPLCGPNDLIFDADGGFYFTDFGKTRARDRDIGSVYYARTDGSSIREVIHPIANPNGVGLSPDGCTLYVSETETSRLWAYEISGPGQIERRPYPSPNGGRLIYGMGGYQRFDSLAVEAGGNICVATLVRGQVSVISPAGELVREVTFPDPHTTNICFGGPDLRRAFVTQSGLGRIYALEWPDAGLPLCFNL